MGSSKLKIFAQFIANLFAGSIFSFAAMWLLLLNFGFDTPSYSLGIIFCASIAGIFTSELVSKKYTYKFHFINIGLFLILPTIVTFIIGIEDWAFAGSMSAVVILYTLLPAIIVTGAINWRKFLKKDALKKH